MHISILVVTWFQYKISNTICTTNANKIQRTHSCCIKYDVQDVTLSLENHPFLSIIENMLRANII